MKGFMNNYFAEDHFVPYGDAEREQMKQNMWDLATYAASVAPVGRIAQIPRGINLARSTLGFLSPDIAANIAGHLYGGDAQRAIDTLGYINRNPVSRIANRILDTYNPDYWTRIKQLMAPNYAIAASRR